jgi:hypothetical protein
MALASTKPLTEISNRNFSLGVKAAAACGRQLYHLHLRVVLKSGNLKILEPSGPVQTCTRIALHFLKLKLPSSCCPQVAIESDWLQISITDEKISNKQKQMDDRRWSTSVRVEIRSRCYNTRILENYTRTLELKQHRVADSCEQCHKHFVI